MVSLKRATGKIGDFFAKKKEKRKKKEEETDYCFQRNRAKKTNAMLFGIYLVVVMLVEKISTIFKV